MTLRIAVAGKSGQVARALARAAAARGVVLEARGRPQLDLQSVDSVGLLLAEVRPDVIINAAAYTLVDKAESEPDAAFRANAGAPAMLATLASHFRIPLIQLSTDYVFDGTAHSPYDESAAISPLGVYGASKAVGEAAIRGCHGQHIILRTAWVYSPDGSNFVRTMLRLGSEREVVRVVADQRGSPTSADDLAAAILDIAAEISRGPADGLWGTYHLTGAGETTWHGFAAEIFRLAALHGLKVPRLEAISTEDYPTPARRPRYSVLDNGKIARAFAIRMAPWQSSLATCMETLMETPAERRQDTCA